MPSELVLQNGVYVDHNTREQFLNFERDYLKIRELEGRVLTVAQIKLLPESPNKHDAGLWKMRKKTISRFRNYLRAKSRRSVILEIGCGNGYFANLLASDGHQVSAVDVNLTELESAAQTFKDTVVWYCLNIMERKVPGGPFDIIVFNASLQYFTELKDLIKRCDQMLSPGGEIHIMDSPFYSTSEKTQARLRTLAHFTKMGYPTMASYYYQHDEKMLSEFHPKILYRSKTLMNRILRLKDSPFPWIMIPKQKS